MLQSAITRAADLVVTVNNHNKVLQVSFPLCLPPKKVKKEPNKRMFLLQIKPSIVQIWIDARHCHRKLLHPVYEKLVKLHVFTNFSFVKKKLMSQ